MDARITSAYSLKTMSVFGASPSEAGVGGSGVVVGELVGIGVGDSRAFGLGRGTWVGVGVGTVTAGEDEMMGPTVGVNEVVDNFGVAATNSGTAVAVASGLGESAGVGDEIGVGLPRVPGVEVGVGEGVGVEADTFVGVVVGAEVAPQAIRPSITTKANTGMFGRQFMARF